MTLNGFKIEELENVKGWFKLTFKSQKNHVGESSFEILCSLETLRFMRNTMNRAMGEKPDYSKDPEAFRKFMEEHDEQS